MNARATFTRMDRGTQQDWQLIGAEFMHFATGLPDRVLAHLKLLEGDYGAFPIDRHHHCRQTATLALRDMFKGHPHYARTAEFIELYDNPAFDPAIETLPIGEFVPMLRRVFAQPKQSVYKAALEAPLTPS